MNYTHFASFILILFAFACKPTTQNHAHEQGKSRENMNGKAEHHHGSANEYMHQASTEDLIKRFESPERDAYQKPAEVIASLGDLNGKKIMDIGAGSGYFSIPLAKAGAQVIAADVDDEFQAHIKKRIETESLENLGIELRKLPYDSPSLEQGEVDLVLVVNTYHHIENRVPYFKQVWKD